MQSNELDIIKRIWKDKLLNNFDKSKEVLQIYVDSPFCIPGECKFCIYKPTRLRKENLGLFKEYYKKILIRNIRDMTDILQIAAPNAVYFGGGTSSLMSIKIMKRIFNELQDNFNFKNVREKHFEFNPIDVTENKINLLMEWGFSHLSFGVQSFDEDVLAFNGRKNVSIERLKDIFYILEKTNVKYNMDLMVFIYKDNLLEDINILRKDLEIAKLLNPRRITIFPNYKKIPDPTLSAANFELAYEKIMMFRKVVKESFIESDYLLNYATLFNKTDFPTNYLLNPKPIRRDVAGKDAYELYNNSGPQRAACPPNYNTIALGGFGQRKPYSYINKDDFIYYTGNSVEQTEYLLKQINAKHQE